MGYGLGRKAEMFVNLFFGVICCTFKVALPAFFLGIDAGYIFSWLLS